MPLVVLTSTLDSVAVVVGAEPDPLPQAETPAASSRTDAADAIEQKDRFMV
jgi:hypothetical protein